MALHSKKEFSIRCGIPTNMLSVYIKRRKVIVKDGYVDDSTSENSAFMQKFSERAEKITDDPGENTKTAETASVTSFKKIVKTPVSIENEREKSTIYKLEQDMKRADLEKKEVDTRIARLKEEKLLGLSIPTDLVKVIITQLSKSLISFFKDGADSFLIEISKRKSLTGAEFAELKGHLVKIINESSAKSLADSKKSLKILIAENSESRGVGEHD